jgi:hypothetical protein
MISPVTGNSDMTSREWLGEVAPGILLVLALGILSTFGYNGVWQRYQLDLAGTVTARQVLPQDKFTHSPTTTLYTLKAGDGSIHEYTATRNDPSLPRTLPVGVNVTKRKGEMFYSVNGRRIDDFPFKAYVILLGVGIVSMIGASILIARGRWPGIGRLAAD